MYMPLCGNSVDLTAAYPASEATPIDGVVVCETAKLEVFMTPGE
jgi:hypothetical protein